MTEITLKFVLSLVQICIALGLMNVWLVRFRKATKYRGGNAKDMMQEFATYGLPVWSVYVVGFLKIVIACLMVVLLVKPTLMYPYGLFGFATLAGLMVGAIAMHVKVKDTLIKMLPASIVLFGALFGFYLAILTW